MNRLLRRKKFVLHEVVMRLCIGKKMEKEAENIKIYFNYNILYQKIHFFYAVMHIMQYSISKIKKI